MPLELVVGPARSGKIGVLATRFLTAARGGDEPVLVVPSAPQVEVVERELAARAGALLGGAVVTFDDLADLVLERTGGAPPAPPDPLRGLLLRRLVARRPLASLAASARFAGFAAALGRFADECAAGAAEPEAVEAALAEAAAELPALGDLAGLYADQRAALGRAGVLERPARLAEAARRATRSLAAWDGRPLLVYGFEELTRAQLDLVEAVAARAEVTLALPFEPGRPAFEALAATFERLAARADRIEELAPGRFGGPAALACLERGLFSLHTPPEPAADEDEAVRLLEVAGAHGEAHAVAAEAAALMRSGVAADEIVVVAPSAEQARGPFERAFEALGVPLSVDARVPLGRTPFGHALLGLCRFAWLEGDRDELFAWLRAPASGLRRPQVDAWEGRLRGRGRRDGNDAYALLQELAGRPVEAVEALRAGPPLQHLRSVLEEAAPAAFGLDGSAGRSPRSVLAVRAWRAVTAALDALAGLTEPPSPTELVRVLETVAVRVGDDRPSGRVRLVGLRRARTHLADVVIVVGLDEGRLPARARPEAFLADDVREALARRGVRLERRDALARDRYLFYTAVTRARRRLVLVRRAAADDGAPIAASPFWDEVVRVLGAAAPAPQRRGLAELTYPLESAPSARERLRALAVVAAVEPQLADRIAAAAGDGWPRRLQRARKALARPTRLVDPELVGELAARARFPVSELESFVDCSQRWFVLRELDPRDIDGTVDPKTRGQVAHAALQRLFTRLPAALGRDELAPGDLERVGPLVDEVVAESLAAIRLPPESLEVLELGRALQRDLRGLVRAELARRHRFVPRRLEVGFGTDRAAPGLKDGLVLGDFAVSGRIDRIDVDPLAARGLVQDYKYSTRAEGARDIGREQRLQLPLYVLALRELLGLEPVGGVYRALLRGGVARGLVRRDARDDGAEGFHRSDYLDEGQFWDAVDEAVGTAREAVRRIRRGDVRHDPRQGTCPAWCDLHPICRVRRA